MKKLLFTLAIVATALLSNAQFTNTDIISSANIMYHNRNSAVADAYIRGHDNGGTAYGRIRLGRAGGTHGASIGDISNGDLLGQMIFQGHHTGWLNAGSIETYSDGTPSSTAMPARMVFKTTPASSTLLVERLRIDVTGYIGIGVTNPLQKLSVTENRASNYAAYFFHDGNSANRYGIKVQTGEDTQTTFNSNYYFRGYDGNGSHMGGLLVFNGVFQLYNISDQRLKTNIQDTKLNCMETLNKIRVVDYNWKETPNGGVVHGFLAQQLQEVMPEMVQKIPDEDRLVITQATLIPVLVRGAQQQDAKIELQKEELVSTKAEIEVLRGELEELKALVSGRKTAVTIENPQGIILNQNDPNPFRETTTIGYLIPENVSSASIIIYDVNGRLVKEVNVQTGAGQLEIYASDLSSGTYTYSIIADGKVIDSKKMMVTK